MPNRNKGLKNRMWCICVYVGYWVNSTNNKLRLFGSSYKYGWQKGFSLSLIYRFWKPEDINKQKKISVCMQSSYSQVINLYLINNQLSVEYVFRISGQPRQAGARQSRDRQTKGTMKWIRLKQGRLINVSWIKLNPFSKRSVRNAMKSMKRSIIYNRKNTFFSIIQHQVMSLLFHCIIILFHTFSFPVERS